MIGTSEAYTLGMRMGLDPKVLMSVINVSSGRNWSSDSYNPVPGLMPNVPPSNDYQGGFSCALMSKVRPRTSHYCTVHVLLLQYIVRSHAFRASSRFDTLLCWYVLVEWNGVDAISLSVRLIVTLTAGAFVHWLHAATT